MQGSLHRIGGQGNHTTKFNLQWQTSSFKSMPPLSLLEARAGTAAHPHRLQAPQGRKCPVFSSKASTAADSSCTSLPQSNTVFSQTHCTTCVHHDTLHKQLSQKQSWASSSVTNAPYCFSRTHTIDAKRKPRQKTKTKPPRIKVLEALFHLVQIKNNRSNLFQL